MNRRFTMLLLSAILAAFVSCGGEDGDESAAAGPPPSGAKTLTAMPTGDNLLSAALGARVVVRPGELSDEWSADRMFDSTPSTGWAVESGSPGGSAFVVAVAEKIALQSIVVDTQNVDGEGRGVKALSLEMSSAGPDGPFMKVADITMDAPQGRTAFALDKESEGQWIRVTVHGNHGDPSITEIMDLEGYGRKLTNVLDQPSLASFAQGAAVVRRPSEESRAWSSLLMIDEIPTTGWASAKGQTKDNAVVIALPEKIELSHVIFDTGSIDGPGRGANNVTIAMSDQNAFGGFQDVASVTLADGRDNQVFPIGNKGAGRWLRLTIRDNHGDPDFTELMEVRILGNKLTETPARDISGTYATEYGDMHIKQEGTFVAGCYEHDEGLIFGGIEGRVLKVSWRESDEDAGPAIMVFSPHGKRMNGLWWFEGRQSAKPGFWDGDKITDEVGKCAHWSGDVGAEIIRDLEELGRARVYGINFDVAAAVVKDESKPTLDKIAAVLKLRPSWKMTVEGHTDSTGGEEYNHELSESRATAVVAYIASQGIDITRLTAIGFGMSQPVASNDTSLGQSQNRRVELKRD